MLAPPTGYAVFALVWLAQQDAEHAVPVRDVASACDMPQPFLSKVVADLVRAGLLRARRGAGGGISLALAPADIPLIAICRAMGDPVTRHRCVLGLARCEQGDAQGPAASLCRIAPFCRARHTALLHFLRQTTIADLAAASTSPRDMASDLASALTPALTPSLTPALTPADSPPSRAPAP